MRFYLSISFIILFFSITYTKTITVSATGTISTIKKAIAISQAGDVISVKQGTYNEYAIVVDKPIKIIGENFPVINGLNKGEIFTIKSNSVEIQGLQLQNTGFSYTEDRAGIKIIRSKFCVIKNNKLINLFFGIYLSYSDSCVVANNQIQGTPKNESNTGNAIHLWNCKSILIDNNAIQGHRDGIYLEFVQNSKILHNKSSYQIRYGLHFMFSNNCEYFKNEFSNNNAGVAVMYSNNIYVHENIFADNWSVVSTGILLKDIKDSKIENNLFYQNTTAIYAEGCMRMSVTKNNFKKNGWAIKILGSSEDNKFLNNNFISNTFEVVTNTSINRNYFDKNYWSGYSGYDLNKDGVGDIPYSPVKLFTYIIENTPPAIILLRSLFVDLLDIAERITPVITPETLKDEQPIMKEIKW